MRALRLIVAGLVAVAAMLAVLFTAAVVLFTGLAGYVVQLFRRQPAPSGPDRPPAGRKDEVIEVAATKITDEPAGR